MSQIILQPSGSRAAVEHYGNTITEPVKLSEVKSKLDPKLTKFLYSLFNIFINSDIESPSLIKGLNKISLSCNLSATGHMPLE